MKINKKLLTVIVLGFIVVAAFVFFGIFERGAELPSDVKAESRMTAPDVIPSSRDVPNSPAKPFVPKTAKEKRWLELGQKMDMGDIRFYGRVIDQHGQPVIGAEVPYQIGGSALGGYRGEGKKITDANGEFSFETEGSSLTIGRINHPEIEFGHPIPESTKTTWDYSHRRSLNIYGFQPQAGDSQVLWSDTSPEKPYVFKAWRIGQGDGEVARSLFEGEHGKSYEFSKFYTLDFSKPLYEVFSEGRNSGDLHVIFERVANPENITQRWEARIIPINGGIQETRDAYMNIAPESGYKPEIQIIKEKTSSYENIDNLVNQQYYITSNNGKHFGSLFVRFNANSYGKMKMTVRYKINPDGERILVKGKSQ